MTTIMIILACGFYQILHVSVWLFIVMYALVRLGPPSSSHLKRHAWSATWQFCCIPACVGDRVHSSDHVRCQGPTCHPIWTSLDNCSYRIWIWIWWTLNIIASKH